MGEVNPEPWSSSDASQRRKNFTNHRMGRECLQPNDVPTHLQTVGWFWSPESIVLRDPSYGANMFGDGPRTVVMATPPAWSLVPGILCQPQTHGLVGDSAIAHMNKWDAGETTSDAERAFHLCDGCPARSECLLAALEEEGAVGAQGRFMIRGGLIPRDRAALAQGMAKGVSQSQVLTSQEELES